MSFPDSSKLSWPNVNKYWVIETCDSPIHPDIVGTVIYRSTWSTPSMIAFHVTALAPAVCYSCTPGQQDSANNLQISSKVSIKIFTHVSEASWRAPRKLCHQRYTWDFCRFNSGEPTILFDKDGIKVIERFFSVPLDYSKPEGEKITIFARNLIPLREASTPEKEANLPYSMYLHCHQKCSIWPTNATFTKCFSSRVYIYVFLSFFFTNKTLGGPGFEVEMGRIRTPMKQVSHDGAIQSDDAESADRYTSKVIRYGYHGVDYGNVNLPSHRRFG